jgi:hypothetical protein
LLKARYYFACILIAGVCLFYSCPVSAQDADTASVTPVVKNHKPNRAVLMSALVPGMGQIYNKKYWKVPIIYGAGGAFVHYLGYYQDKYTKFRTAIENGEEGGEYLIDGRIYDYDSLDEGRDFYRRYRDLNVAGIGLIYFLNIVDAMIDAHFFYYDVSDSLTMQIQPAVLNSPGFSTNYGATSSVGLQINFTF